jgi:hypothetical protein
VDAVVTVESVGNGGNNVVAMVVGINVVVDNVVIDNVVAAVVVDDGVG